MLDELMGRIGGRFARVEPWRRARAFVLGCWLTCRTRTAGASLSTLAMLPSMPTCTR
jgi:hypothetical protein